MDTAQALDFLTGLAAWAKPIVILTGGEPLLREDIFDIAAHGTGLGLRMVMAPNGTPAHRQAGQEGRGMRASPA